MLRPAPAERTATLEARVLPGRALRMLEAVSLGSLEGTAGGSARRAEEVVKAVDVGREVRARVEGRARAAPRVVLVCGSLLAEA